MLLFLAPPLARASLVFSAPEFFLVALFGLTIIGSLAGDNMIKGLLSGLFGLAIGVIGFDQIYGVRRFTYGITALEAGISLVPALIGLFSISQVLILAEDLIKKDEDKKVVGELRGRLLPTLPEFVTQVPNIIRSSIIGLIIGIVPGPGAEIGGWLGYSEAKRFSKNREQFGKGAIEGVWACETANNATVGGALVPTMTLGIPGSSAAAILLGGMMLHGLIPGHGLFTTQADIAYAIIFGFLIANILMGIVGLLTAKYLVKVASAPTSVLAPCIVVLSVIGAYAINISLVDVSVMAIFGIIGYFMRKTGFATAPVVLAMILGSIAENGYKRAVLMARGENLLTFYMGRPVSVVLILLIVFSLFAPLIMSLVQRKMAVK
jgi:putative tricarboxylic transport membrane protein